MSSASSSSSRSPSCGARWCHRMTRRCSFSVVSRPSIATSRRDATRYDMTRHTRPARAAGRRSPRPARSARARDRAPTLADACRRPPTRVRKTERIESPPPPEPNKRLAACSATTANTENIKHKIPTVRGLLGDDAREESVSGVCGLEVDTQSEHLS